MDPCGAVVAGGIETDAPHFTQAKKWDSTTGGLLAVMQGHVGPITSVQWMSEGKHVVTSSLDKVRAIYHAQDGP